MSAASRVLLALPAILLSAASPVTGMANEERPPAAERPVGPDVWPEHAASDSDVAREGRAALPFTEAQIEALGRLLRRTQEATARGEGEPPRGRIRRIRIAAPGNGAIPEIAVRRGYATAVSFTDATGAPWPIENALVDRRFLPEAILSETGEDGEGRESHLLYLVPQRRYLHGNAVVELRGLAEPVVAVLRGGGGEADFRVDVRLGLPGPDADPALLVRPEGFHAGDPQLLELLGGTIPPDAERLAVEGGARDDRAWRSGGGLLLLTRAHLLSPGPRAAERGPGGRWAYRLPDTPYALVTRGGREARLGFREREDASLFEEAGDDE